jgi:hypothetical protein
MPRPGSALWGHGYRRLVTICAIAAFMPVPGKHGGCLLAVREGPGAVQGQRNENKVVVITPRIGIRSCRGATLPEYLEISGDRVAGTDSMVLLVQRPDPAIRRRRLGFPVPRADSPDLQSSQGNVVTAGRPRRSAAVCALLQTRADYPTRCGPSHDIKPIAEYLLSFGLRP